VTRDRRVDRHLRFDVERARSPPAPPASGQDLHSEIADPRFTSVPSSGFDSTKIAIYNFCTSLIPVLCR
jgi:hypothetical protein